METVRIIYHHEADGWWAESPDIEGWSVAGDSFSEVRALVNEGISLALGSEARTEHRLSATVVNDRGLGK
jgi:predicted RNase H-like HicB family nuclease